MDAIAMLTRYIGTKRKQAHDDAVGAPKNSSYQLVKEGEYQALDQALLYLTSLPPQPPASSDTALHPTVQAPSVLGLEEVRFVIDTIEGSPGSDAIPARVIVSKLREVYGLAAPDPGGYGTPPEAPASGARPYSPRPEQQGTGGASAYGVPGTSPVPAFTPASHGAGLAIPVP